ncbi:MAG: Clp protease N-terminal domain-containing protein [Gaiellaceae bacterium]
MMTLDEQLLGEAKQVRDRLLDLQHDVDRARVDYQHVIRRLHAAGGSLREIAEELGLSHQRVHQIVEEGPVEIRRDEPRRGRMRRREGPFGRFNRLAREVVVQAQAESAELGHHYLGTEHLLLGLFRVEAGGAATALSSLGLTVERVREDVVRAVGDPRRTGRGGAMPLTQASKKALELAVAEARGMGFRWIGTEHVLLGLMAGEGLAAELLADAGADAERVRAAVERVLGR